MKVRLSAVKFVPKSRTFDRGSKKKSLRVRSYKDTKLLCPYWKTFYNGECKLLYSEASRVSKLLKCLFLNDERCRGYFNFFFPTIATEF